MRLDGITRPMVLAFVLAGGRGSSSGRRWCLPPQLLIILLLSGGRRSAPVGRGRFLTTRRLHRCIRLQ